MPRSAVIFPGSVVHGGLPIPTWWFPCLGWPWSFPHPNGVGPNREGTPRHFGWFSCWFPFKPGCTLWRQVTGASEDELAQEMLRQGGGNVFSPRPSMRDFYGLQHVCAGTESAAVAMLRVVFLGRRFWEVARSRRRAIAICVAGMVGLRCVGWNASAIICSSIIFAGPVVRPARFGELILSKSVGIILPPRSRAIMLSGNAFWGCTFLHSGSWPLSVL